MTDIATRNGLATLGPASLSSNRRELVAKQDRWSIWLGLGAMATRDPRSVAVAEKEVDPWLSPWLF